MLSLELEEWRNLWLKILAAILGIPTLCLTWCLWYSFSHWNNRSKPWRLTVVDGLENWIFVLKILGLILAAIPSLFFTLYLITNQEKRPLERLRAKYSPKNTLGRLI